MNSLRTMRHERRKKIRQRKTLIALVAGGLILIAASFAIANAASKNRADLSLVEVSGQPSLKVDQEIIDYGDVKLNTNLDFTLRLTNVGDQPLRISETPTIEVKEGC